MKIPSEASIVTVPGVKVIDCAKRIWVASDSKDASN